MLYQSVPDGTGTAMTALRSPHVPPQPPTPPSPPLHRLDASVHRAARLHSRYGVAALHKATSFGQSACVSALLSDRRVAVDQPCGMPTVPQGYEAKSGGETALHLACSHTYTFHHAEHVRIARRLLAAGADPNLVTVRGRSAVHCAVAAGNVAILKELAACGRVAADTWSRADVDGNTPLQLARSHEEIVALLRAALRTPTRAQQHAGSAGDR